jgi:hypothetical protein
LDASAQPIDQYIPKKVFAKEMETIEKGGGGWGSNGVAVNSFCKPDTIAVFPNYLWRRGQKYSASSLGYLGKILRTAAIESLPELEELA